MKTTMVAALTVFAPIGLLAGSAHGLMLAPGQSGLTGASERIAGTTIAEHDGTFVEALSDALVTDQFRSTVGRTDDGKLVFTYYLSAMHQPVDLVTVPLLLQLNGFVGVTTDIYASTWIPSGGEPVPPTWTASRSDDGNTLSLSNFTGNASTDVFVVEVRTDAADYVFGPGVYVPTYVVRPMPLPPPSVTPDPFYGSFPTDAFSPASSSAAAVPEPASVALLPLAIGALGLRMRRRASGR